MFGIRDIIVLTLLAASLPVCFFRPFFGILMWEIVAFMNPHRFAFGGASYTPVAFLIAVPTLAGFVVFSPGWKRFFSREVCLIAILWLWFTLTTFRNTQMPEFAYFADDTWNRWKFVSKILLMTVATIAVVNRWDRFRWLLLVISGSFGLFVLKAIPFMIATRGSFRLYGPEGSMVADNNDLGLALNMTLPMFFFLARMDPNPKIRWLMGILVIATIPSVFFTYSRGALVGLAVILFLMVMRLRQRLVLIPLLVLAGVFAAFLTPQKWQQRMDITKQGALLDDSAASRLNAWHYCWNLAVDYPLTGGGFEAFTPELFTRYAPNPMDVHGPHSIYFGVLAEHGFIGLFLYLSLIGSSFLTLRWIRKYARVSGDDRAADYASMLSFSIVGFLVSGAFLGRAYFDYFFALVACAAALKRLCRLDPAESESFEPQCEDQAELEESEFLPEPTAWTVATSIPERGL